MGTVTVEKIADLEYNELVALNIIEKDKDLFDMFSEDVKLPFAMLYRMSKEGLLSDEIKLVIFTFFDRIILANKAYSEKYFKVLNSDIDAMLPTEEKLPIVAEVIEVAPVKKVVTKKTTGKVNELPKWHGKNKVLEDIKNQDSPATAPQLAVISINDIHNIYLKMTRITINDMFTDNRILTDEQYRKVKAANKTYANQIKSIFKDI